MTEDPWVKEVEGLKTGAKVKGSITRITPFGAFVQISPAVEALVRIADMGDAGDDKLDPEKLFKLGDTKEFTVSDIDKDGRKVSLSYK